MMFKLGGGNRECRVLVMLFVGGSLKCEGKTLFMPVYQGYHESAAK